MFSYFSVAIERTGGDPGPLFLHYSHLPYVALSVVAQWLEGDFRIVTVVDSGADHRPASVTDTDVAHSRRKRVGRQLERGRELRTVSGGFEGGHFGAFH